MKVISFNVPDAGYHTVGAESMAHAESMARRRFAAAAAAPVHFLKDFFFNNQNMTF